MLSQYTQQIVGVLMSERVILQSEAAECGLACLVMVLRHYGSKVELVDLRRQSCISLKGASLSTLLRIAAHNSLQVRALRIELNELSQLETPCILHWDLNHYIVLDKVAGDHLEVRDPALGKRKISLVQASQSFTGVAVEIEPSAGFRAEVKKPSISFSGMIGSVWGLRRALLQLLLLSITLQFFALAAPLLSQLVMDHVILSNDKNLLVIIIVGFALLNSIQLGIGLLRQWAGMVLSARLSLQWNANVLMHTLRLPKDFFERRHLGDIISRMGSIGAIQNFLTNSAIGVILDGLMALTTLLVMLKYNAILFYISLAALIVYFLIRFVSYRLFKEANEEQLVLSSRQDSYFIETLRGIGSIKIAGNEQQRHATWLNLATDSQNQGIRVSKMGRGCPRSLDDLGWSDARKAL